ncbi:MAG: (d)CMP kinase [Clostridia bacterium]|nr:(d)CMP kinase [Clostridia bacterium]
MINIAIDGHVSSGKSTLAKGVAKALGLKVLDTGAIYRGLACAYKEGDFGEINKQNIEKFLKDIKVEVKFQDKKQLVFVNDKDYTPFLRLEEISNLSSSISPYKNLREVVTKIQRTFAQENNCIIEGRDIGTEILPNATIKLFVTASAEERARRRFLQVKDTGTTFEKVLADLKERDRKDETRAVAPLKIAKDAIVVDTTNMNLDEAIAYSVGLIQQKINKNFA